MHSRRGNNMSLKNPGLFGQYQEGNVHWETRLKNIDNKNDNCQYLPDTSTYSHHSCALPMLVQLLCGRPGFWPRQSDSRAYAYRSGRLNAVLSPWEGRGFGNDFETWEMMYSCCALERPF